MAKKKITMKTMNIINQQKKQLPTPGNPICWEMAELTGMWVFAILVTIAVGWMMQYVDF